MTTHAIDRVRKPLRRLKRLVLERLDRRRPLKDVFTRIYRRNEWGGEQGEFCSGAGSASEATAAYTAYVREFIASHGISRVADLGCGDFRVGRQIISPEIAYVGVDIVDELIARNRERFGSDSCQFRALDILTDPLPEADLCCVRQVLQHLSNEEITVVLRKLSAYPYVLITEHHPAPDRLTSPNRNKAHGRYVRIYDGSGVYLDRPPFGLAAAELVLSTPVAAPLVATGEMLNTFLIRNGA